MYPPYLLHGWRRYALTVVLAALVAAFMVFVRWGGSFNYERGVSWLSAGVTNDDFLNECILDDVQALYRVRDFAKNMREGKVSGVDAARVREFAERIAGHGDLGTADLRPYLEREAQGARLPRPRHIFIVLGESWAQWPMMEQYAPLHAADGIKSLMAEPNAYATRAFLPNGEGTAVGITGVVTGLSAVSVDAQYQLRSFEAPYITALAPQFRRLGYQVDFWYGGISSWDSMNRFTVAQGFDHFYGYPDFGAPRQNAWGTTDGYLFAALADHLAAEPPTVHVVMTVTNHPPYNLDLAAEGFDLAAEMQETARMARVEDAETLAVELGHYWYMDRVVTDFVRQVSKAYPDSLFVLTGDHATRMDPGTAPTLFEHQSIPFVLYGQGVTPGILPPNAAGGHTSILPTLMELIAPQGFRYYSLAQSMTQDPAAAFSSSTWVTKDAIGELAGGKAEAIPGRTVVNAAAEKEKAEDILPMMRTLSWWLIEKGSSLEE